MRSFDRINRMEQKKYVIPKSVQKSIPIQRVYPDGIFLYEGAFSKTWRFEDINYAIAGKDDKTGMFLDYSELLNSLDSGATAKITIANRRVNRADFEESILLRRRDDELNALRREYNAMLLGKVTSDGIVQER